MLFLFFIALLLTVFWYIKKYTYWKVRNVKHDIPLPLFGNHIKNVFGMRTETEMGMEMYKKYSKEKIVGYYRGTTPVLIVRDPDLIRYVLNKNFTSFHGRGLGRDHERMLMLNVFYARGDCWRLLRTALSPTFTTAKLRNMFPLIKKCTVRLQDVALKLSESGKAICGRELMERYTTEFIGACGFGIDMNTINTEKSLFIELGKMIFTKTKWQLVFIAVRELFAKNWLANNISITRDDIRIIIMDIMRIIREQRKKDNIKRNDFVDLLLELENAGVIEGDSLTRTDEKGFPVKTELIFTEEYTAAQLFIFFAAGFETSAGTISWTLHQLAHHPHVQSKVHDEIDKTLKKHNGLNYDAVNELLYLEMTIKEAIRTFSPGGYLSRECMKKNSIPGTDVTIDPGVIINIPVQALHLDPKYYDNPTEFRPERFLPEEEKKRHKYVYLPFGEGPRKCIGSRLGLIQSMSGLVAILQNFTVVPAPNSKRNFKVKRNAFLVQAIEGGLPIVLKPRK
ncbi:cytochrome P450 6B7-like [Battus philenor]|uniref:cytochrome P450 6B7-like n=1 Tax=Battus philenor TaxID=42288 RepID=UPI0035CEE0A9